ncbi:hypothetical protein Tco_0772951 [Tanacetum coccineum]|uniref:Uncharacterized protein n=1 Tax=Tanacetum coccineum TaxID=301880 RepID=A0ABQ4ZJH2_9ASTR
MPSFPSPKPKVSCFDDLDFFKDFENEFSAIVYNDALTSKSDHLTEPTLSPQHIDEFDLKDETSLPNMMKWHKSECLGGGGVRVSWVYYEGEGGGAAEREHTRLKGGRRRSVECPSCSSEKDAQVEGLTELMDDGLRGRMLMEHRDAQGQSVFTSRAWRRLFKIRGPLVHELILEFFSTFRFGEEIESVRFGAYWAESARQIPDKGDMSAYWIAISSAVDFLGTTPSYTSIRGLMLRLCHRLITCNIVGRSQAPEKVFEGLTMIVRDLPVIDMAELVRLQICVELDDTWAWVAPGPERQQVDAAGAPEAAEDAPVVD